MAKAGGIASYLSAEVDNATRAAGCRRSGEGVIAMMYEIIQVTVPVQPTQAMLRAYKTALKRHIDSMPDDLRIARWGRPMRRGGRSVWNIPESEKALVRYQAMLEAAQVEQGPAILKSSWIGAFDGPLPVLTESTTS